MSRLTVRVTRFGRGLAECSVLYDGEHVGESSWVFEPWNNRWTYSGDCRDCWADDDLLEFLDAHDPDENPDVEDLVSPEDLRVLADKEIKKYESRSMVEW